MSEFETTETGHALTRIMKKALDAAEANISGMTLEEATAEVRDLELAAEHVIDYGNDFEDALSITSRINGLNTRVKLMVLPDPNPWAPKLR